MSIDQLTEEAEADLANNNDPNNNSSNNEENQIGENMPQQQKFREIGIGKTASIESNIITIINYFAFFSLYRSTFTTRATATAAATRRDSKFPPKKFWSNGIIQVFDFASLILLVIINLTKTINFTEKSNICELPFPEDVLVS